MSKNIWSNDTLGREEEAQVLLRFLESRLKQRSNADKTQSYVLNVDAGWGHGKTFFLDKLAQELKQRGHVVAQVNAWETDFSEEPLIAVMSAIDTALQPFLRKKAAVRTAWRAAVQSGGTLAASLIKHVTAKAASKYAGDFIDDAADIIAGANVDPPVSKEGAREAGDQIGIEKGTEEGIEKLADRALAKVLAAFREQERSIAMFRRQLSQVARSIHSGNESETQRIYVLVDELDRCRPSYAITLLEAAKHLFHTDGVVFIIATDTAQLSESVKAVYGSGFDSSRYLLRFFDRTYRFKKPNRDRFIQTLLASQEIEPARISIPPDLPLSEVCLAYFDAFEVSLRDIEQCLDMFSTVVSIWDQPVAMQVPHMLPLIILYQQNEMAGFDYVAHGAGNKPENFLKGNPALLEGYVYNRNDGTQRRVLYRVSDFLDAYRGALGSQLHEINMGDTVLGRWLNEKFREEFATIHKNLIHRGKKQRSIIRGYDGYVKLAVRFADGPAQEGDAAEIDEE